MGQGNGRARARRAKRSTAHRNRGARSACRRRYGTGPRGNRRRRDSAGEPAADAARDHGDHGRHTGSRGATSTLDLDAFVPNAVIAPLGAGWGSTAAAFIRGIGLGDNSLSFEPGVPIYIDDVYHGRPQGAVMDLLDIERVEILRAARHAVRQEHARRRRAHHLAQTQATARGSSISASARATD